MKKVLLFVGAAAVMASCSQDELIPNDVAQNAAVKGIVFETGAPAQDETRGELHYSDESGKYHFGWYAEHDKINIYATNVVAQEIGDPNTANVDGKGVLRNATNTNWNEFDVTATPAVYKSTTSGARGFFTANSDQDWISFNLQNNQKVMAVATYPTSTTLQRIRLKDERVKESGVWKYYTDQIQWAKINATVPSEQNGVFDYVSAPMYSISEGTRANRYESVGEKISLSFKRAFPVIKFSGVANNDTYNNDLGNLVSIKLTSNGGNKDGYSFASRQLAGNAVYQTNNNETTNITGASNVVTVNISDGNWTSNKAVYMAILPVKNEGVKSDGSKKNIPDNMVIEYEYANITLRYPLEAPNAWTTPNQIVEAPALDIAAKYPYIVTKGTAGEERKLIVNTGALPTVYEVGGIKYIIWDDANSTTVWINNSLKNQKVIPVTNVSEIEVRSGANVIDGNGYTNIRNYTNLKTLRIKNNTTTLVNNALYNLTNLETLELTNVTNVQYNNGDTPVDLSGLKNVYMPAYDFSQRVNLTKAILGADLERLDMRGVASMKQVYPKEGMTLMNYSNLQQVTVQDGVILGPEAFKGCINLTTVNGKVFLGGYSEFENCASVNNINLSDGTNIPEYSFKGATTLANIWANGVNIAPQTIGISAFQGATALENINLGNTTTIGANAFNGCTNFKGVYDNNKQIWTLDVNAATIGASAFESTAVQYVKFSNLTTVEGNLLNGASSLIQLKFAKKITFAEAAYNNEGTTFGTSGNITLFVNPGQETEANKLKVKYSNKAVKDVTFKTIVKE
ncbi:MAG: leucine-rich repeat protein [Bacteroidaceae bacterium]|nr:leucine-rich repeat protein [Bacteroidaceae bacterium]